MSAALRTTHCCLLPIGHIISYNNERGSVFLRSRLTDFKARLVALKPTTGDNLQQRRPDSVTKTP